MSKCHVSTVSWAGHSVAAASYCPRAALCVLLEGVKIDFSGKNSCSVKVDLRTFAWHCHGSRADFVFLAYPVLRAWGQRNLICCPVPTSALFILAFLA